MAYGPNLMNCFVYKDFDLGDDEVILPVLWHLLFLETWANLTCYIITKAKKWRHDAQSFDEMFGILCF